MISCKVNSPAKKQFFPKNEPEWHVENRILYVMHTDIEVPFISNLDITK